MANVESAKLFLNIVEEFGSYSGLLLNMSKTEALWIGENRNCDFDTIGVSYTNPAIKLLGVFVSNDLDLTTELNLKERIKTIRSVINSWKRRNLTLIGKIVILKTFIISQFQYVLSAIHIPAKYIKEINDIMFSFIWNGKRAKIRKEILCQPRQNGGLSAPDLELIMYASRLRWLKHYCNSDSTLWKGLFKYNLDNLGVNFDLLLHCNFVEANLDLNKLQPFYQDLVRAWSIVSGADNQPPGEQCIWYNKRLTDSTINVMSSGLFKSGVWFYADLFMENGDLIPFEVWQQRGVKLNDYIIWHALVTKVSVLY